MTLFFLYSYLKTKKFGDTLQYNKIGKNVLKILSWIRNEFKLQVDKEGVKRLIL